MRRGLSIRGQVIRGVVLIAALSILCSTATYALIAHTLLHGQIGAAGPSGGLIRAVRFRVQPPGGTPGTTPGWLVSGTIALLILTPFLYIGAFAYLFAWRFSRAIGRPIRTLVEAARRIQARDLDFHIEPAADDEIGGLLRAFEEMRADLKDALLRQWTLESERRELLEAVSHDLRTPLTIIQGHAEILAELPGLPEPAGRCVAAIRRNSARIARLVADFRTATDLDSPHFALVPGPVDLDAFFRERLAEYADMAQHAAVRLEPRIVDGRAQPRTVEMDADRLSQVLDNILANALRYTPREGRIEFAVTLADGELAVRVHDSGPGFSPQDMNRAFHRFYRGDAARSRSAGHAGLGLHIARELVERQGGRIAIGNDPVAGGAVVALQLPIRALQDSRAGVS